MHTETALRNAIFELIQEGDAAFLIVNVDAHTLWCDFRMSLELGSKGVVVGREEAESADVRGHVVQHGLGDGHTVVGAGTAAQFVKDDKRTGCGFRENLLGLGELDEEGRLGGEDIVVCT